MIFYEPDKRDRSVLPHDPFKSLVAPRPIGWISTMDAAGRVNLAPYSFGARWARAPHMLAFSSRGATDSSTLDSRRAARVRVEPGHLGAA